MPQRVLFALIALIVALNAPARADDFTNQLNDLYKNIQQDKRSDLILLPVVAKMDAPPAAIETPEKALVLPVGAAAWSAAETWANSAPQRAVLETLHKITQEENPVLAYAFGQPYGSDAVGSQPGGIDLIKANLYTELGDPPLLSGAKFLYLPALDRVGALVNVEATRLASSGKVAEAIDQMIDWLFFARQMADRAMFAESRWGFHTMNVTLDRIRDVAYVDFRYGTHALTPEQITSTMNRLRADGYIGVDRIVFPRGDEIGAKQVIATAFLQNDGPNKDTFAPTMSRLASTQRPLRLFAESARWNDVMAVHANAENSNTAASGVFGDWYSRWALDPFDPGLTLLSGYEKLGKRRYAALLAIVQDESVLFNDRQVLRTQLVGTRCALGVVAFYYRAKDFPPTLDSIRPTFVKVIEPDPFNSDRANKRLPHLEYFVPVRDEPQTESPKPHEMNVVTRDLNFQVKVDKDQFILYSVGPDGAKGWARDVSGEPAKNAIGDLLIWPPVVSLVRQRLQETGQIK
jgi:hypothetical protein